LTAVRPAVVVTHGVWFPGTETWPLRRSLHTAGYDVRLFRYHSVAASLEANAARLAEFVARTAKEGVHLVGHSLGGVVILEALARHRIACGRVVCLGSPLVGSGTAAAVAAWPSGRRIIGKCLDELLARGGIGSAQLRTEIGVIAGSRSFGVGRFIASLARPNDGTVTVAETRLPGATDHIVLPVSHYGMLWSATVVEQIRWFLTDGKFRHDRTV
jgi:pimeloyl-ACP methyl ester carboxylesterase